MDLSSFREAYFEVYSQKLDEISENLSEEVSDESFDIQEGEGSYGQTPKARAAMGRVAIARREKPASEYSQKGEKTRKVREIEKHTRRIDNGPDAGDHSKKSTKPRWSGFAGKSGRGKLDQDSRDYSRETSAEYGSGTSGSGTVTKNPKKLRKQKAMGEIGEGYDIFDVILEHLVAEGYADTNEAALVIMANMSEDWRQSIVEEVLDEAEGSYGETPKAYGAAKKTKMTAKRKPFLNKMLSRTNPANRTDPYGSPRKGLTADDRERARAGSKHGVGTRQDHDYPSEGPGGVTKSAKKLRKQKAMGEHD